MPEPVNQICINSPEFIASLIGYVVMGASALANLVPAPDKIQNKFLKAVSRVVHFVAIDVITAVKK